MVYSKVFFAKYNAVPATDHGPDWSQATDTALAGWVDADCDNWDARPEIRDGLLFRLVDLYRELMRRYDASEPDSDRRCEITRLRCRIAGRVGGVRLHELIEQAKG